MTEPRHDLAQDILAARHDLVALAQLRDLRPVDLADWMNDPQNHHLLAALCQLADYQTQVLISRYRLYAAGKLLELAQGEGETARKACVELLKTDLKRAVPPEQPASPDDLHEAETFWKTLQQLTAVPVSLPPVESPSCDRTATRNDQADCDD